MDASVASKTESNASRYAAAEGLSLHATWPLCSSRPLPYYPVRFAGAMSVPLCNCAYCS